MAADDHETTDFPDQQRTETPQLEALRAAGYTDDFDVAHGELVLRGVGPVDLATVHIDQQYRFEGASDPDYESLVLALHSPATGARGVLVTAESDIEGVDFVSRCFFPALGVPEDPVTGSAHCALAMHWRDALGKEDMVGYQASPRGGTVRCAIVGDRVELTGRAVTTLTGSFLA